MTAVGVTMRVTSDAHGERRDAIDQRWLAFLEACGLSPVLLSNANPERALRLAREELDGIVLTGGNDLGSLGGDAPERDAFEQALLDHCLHTGMPLLGVCRGMQVIQHAFGVPLHRVDGHVQWEQSAVIDGAVRQVNSFHRWGSRGPQGPLHVWATATDELVKAVRVPDKPVVGIMWHPERLAPFAPEDIALFRDHFSRPQAVPQAVPPGQVVWITGLSGAGKTTVGRLVAQRLRELGRRVVFLDGDILREVFGNDLGHGLEDRRRSATRNARLCKLLSDQGQDVVCCTISMFNACRDWNRREIAPYLEVYLRTPIQELRRRDTKGLYRAGRDVYGLDLPFEEPMQSDLVLDNWGDCSPEESARRIVELCVNHAARFSPITAGAGA